MDALRALELDLGARFFFTTEKELDVCYKITYYYVINELLNVILKQM